MLVSLPRFLAFCHSLISESHYI